MRTMLAVLLGACVLAATPTAAAQETAPIASPPVAIITGAVLLGVSYVPSYAAWLGQSLQQIHCLNTEQGWGIFSCGHVSERTLAVPLVGPWTTLANGQLPGGQWTAAQKTELVADGLAQDLGFALAAYGAIRLLTTPRHAGPAEPPPALTIQPGAGTAMAGVTTVLRF